MSGRIFPGFTIATLVLMGACSSSPPTRFYTLSETAPETHSGAQLGADSVRIYRVAIPGELDRPQLVRRVDANRLQIAEQDRWAAPLDEMIRRVLSGDLARRLSAGPLADASDASPAGGQHSLSVEVREFYGDANCNVTLRAAWTPKESSATAHPQTSRATTEDIHVSSTGPCPDGLPATMSVALGQLSDRIVAGISLSPSSSNK